MRHFPRLTIATTTLASLAALAAGCSTSEPDEDLALQAQTLEEPTSFRYDDARKVDNSVGSSLEWSYRRMFDFNGDGVADPVECSTDTYVKIIDGARPKRTLYEWSGPAKTKTVDGREWRRELSSCEIVPMKDSAGKDRPVILLGNYWYLPHIDWRATTQQYAVFWGGNEFVQQPITVEGFGDYWAVARSIKCDRYPAHLVNRYGYAPGALCFVAGYEWGYKTHTALLKLELTANDTRITAKDLTPSSDLPWRQGVRGTSIYDFPVRPGFASNQRDGAFMIDSAFVSGGAARTDLVTLAVHGSFRAHTMVVDPSRAEGVRFTTQTSSTGPSEWRIASDLDRREPSLRSEPCVYLSAVDGGVYDHIRCREGNTWTSHALPLDYRAAWGAKVQPWEQGAKFRLDDQGAMLLKVRKADGNDATFRIPKG